MSEVKEHILDSAKTIINGERQGQYGNAENSFDTISKMWSAYLHHDISAVDVANMMILLKVARNSSGAYKDDKWIDICGYAALGGDIQSKNDVIDKMSNSIVDMIINNAPIEDIEQAVKASQSVLNIFRNNKEDSNE